MNLEWLLLSFSNKFWDFTTLWSDWKLDHASQKQPSQPPVESDFICNCAEMKGLNRKNTHVKSSVTPYTHTHTIPGNVEVCEPERSQRGPVRQQEDREEMQNRRTAHINESINRHMISAALCNQVLTLWRCSAAAPSVCNYINGPSSCAGQQQQRFKEGRKTRRS